MNGHLTDADLRAFARHALPADRLLAVDDHLAACEACRQRAADAGRVAAGIAALRTDTLALDAHLSEDDVERFVTGALSIGERADMAAHVEDCALCRGEVDDLRRWVARRVRRRWPIYAGAAAAAVLVLTLAWPWITAHVAPAPAGTSGIAIAGLEQLSDDRRAQVRAAVQAGAVDLPAWLDDWSDDTERLMGAPPGADAFRLTAPVMTGVVDVRPTLRWTALTDADDYSVVVLDEDLRPAAGPATLPGTIWMPPAALERGRSYVWQVTARRGAQTVTAPTPPAPMARFRVIDAAAAAEIARVADAAPQAHLLLGILLAQAGARDDAACHLRQVPPDDAYRPVAQRTLEHLGASAQAECAP